jgi:hypothetical protein
MGRQSCGSLDFGNFGTPGTKSHLDVGLMKRHIIYYKVEGGGFPQVQAMVSLMNLSLPVACLSTKSVSIMHSPTSCLVCANMSE